MEGRTFAIGDIHADLAAVNGRFPCPPTVVPDDTVVFLDDHLDGEPPRG